MAESIKVGMISEHTSSMGTKSSGRLEKIITSVNRQGLDILVAPEWYFYNGKPLRKKQKEDIVEEIKAGCDRKALILPGTFIWTEDDELYNTLPIIANGKYYRDYHKSSDGGTTSISRKHKKFYFFGDSRGVVFEEWRSLKIGLEICADHGGLALNKNTGLHMQILIACGITLFDDSMAIRKGGIAFCCDGSSRMMQARKNLGENYKAYINHEKIVPLSNDSGLYVYEIEI